MQDRDSVDGVMALFTWTVVRRFIVNQIHSFEPFAAAENNRQVTRVLGRSYVVILAQCMLHWTAQWQASIRT